MLIMADVSMKAKLLIQKDYYVSRDFIDNKIRLNKRKQSRSDKKTEVLLC
jgi:hypothetical protein